MGSIRPSYEWRARNAEQKRASIDDAERAVLAAAKAWNLALGTPAALDAFTKAFHPRLIGLTGSPAAIAEVAKAYGVYFQKSPGSTPDAYLVDHSRSATLYGPEGAPIAFIPETGSPEDIARELGRWVR